MTSHSNGRRVSARVGSIDKQKIRVMFDLAEQYDGEDLVHLELGEPDFDTPKHIVEAAHDAAENGATHYTSNAGMFELRDALCDKLSAETGRTVDPATQIAITTGGVEALHLAIHTVADPGEEIVIPTPTWPNPISQSKLASAVPIEVPMPAADDFSLDSDRVIEHIGPQTAAVVLISPSNPTGRVIDPEPMNRVIDAAVEHDAYVLADETYRELTYDETPPRVAGMTEHTDRILSVSSFSKTYAMTGWRVGWISGPEDVLDEITKIHESTTSCVNTPAQHAAIAALRGPQEPIEEMKREFETRRAYVVDRLAEIPHLSAVRPDGGFYAFVDVSELDGSSMDIAKRLLYEYEVVTAPGVAFGDGAEGYLRLSFANDLDRLETGLDRLESMVERELGAEV